MKRINLALLRAAEPHRWAGYAEWLVGLAREHGTVAATHIVLPDDVHVEAIAHVAARVVVPALPPMVDEPKQPNGAWSWPGLGLRLWTDWHTERHPTPAHIGHKLTQIPCGPCKAHATAYVAKNPPPYDGQPGYFAWSVAFHNAVNRRRGVPVWTLDEAAKRWGRTD